MTTAITSTGLQADTLEQIKADIEARQLANISSTLDIATASPLGQVNGILASKLRELVEVAQAAYDAFDPDAASDYSLTKLCLLTGTKRNAATKSTVVCTVNVDAGTYAIGDLVANVSGNADARFVNTAAVTNAGPGAANFSASFAAEETGPVQAASGALTVISEPVVGWNSVTNLLAAELGKDIETDVALRLRRAIELSGAGSATIDAIRADVAAVTGVQSVQVFENDTDVNVAGMPPHSIEAVLYDGVGVDASNNAIAQAIFDSKAGGIKSHGAVSGVATDTAGVAHTILFTRVAIRNVYLELDIAIDAALYPADPAFKTAIAAIALAIGQDVILNRARAAAMAVAGVMDITAVRAGFTASPVGVINLVIGSREIADLDTTRVVVNTVAFVDS